MISDSTTSTSTTTVPTNKNLTGAFTQANSAFLAANGANANAITTGTYANSAFLAANGANANAITTGTYANAAFLAANTGIATNLTQNTSITAAFTQANTGVTNAATADSKAVTAGSYANSAYTQANTATTNAATADSKAVTAGSYANSAFTTANNAFPKTGGTLTGDLGVTGNLFVNGTSSFINVATFQTVDSLIKLGANNLSDTIDIGFYGQYVATGTKYAGLVRKAGGNYVLFQGTTSDPTSNSVGAISFANYGTLNANIAAGQITSSQPIPVLSGGTGVTTSTGSGSVVLSTSPSLTTPALGTPSSGVVTNLTGTASININGTVGATTPSTGAFTTLSASSTVSGTGFSTYLASPPAIGGTTAAAGSFSNLSYTGTLTGGTGVVNFGSGQFYKDASGKLGLGTATPAVTLAVAATDAILVPNGTTAQRPTGAAGYIRYNSTTGTFEGYSSAWGAIGGGATGSSGDQVFYENGQTVNANYTITTAKNAGSFGPITIASGVTVTVPSGSTWSIV